MTVEVHLSEKEFIEVSFVLFYRKPGIKIVAVIAALLLLIVAAGLLFVPGSFEVTSLIFPLFFTVALPLSVYSSARNLYKTNHQVREKAIFRFTDEQLFIQGETYHVSFTWNTLPEVTQTKNWILIWQNKMKAYPLPAKDLWGGQIAGIKDILEKNRVKNNLSYLP